MLVSLIVGASRLGVSHDGVVLVAGTANTSAGDVTVHLFALDAEGGPILVQQATTPESFVGLGGSRSMLIDDEGAGLVANNYNLDAAFGGDLTSADGNAGVP